MAFNTWLFLAFIIVSFFVYWNVQSKYRLNILLLVNIIFYIASDIRYLPALLFVIVVTYFGGIQNKKIFCRLAIVLVICNLLFLKYSVMLLDSICMVYPIRTEYAIRIIAPLGVSFYSLEAIGYLIDVLKGKIKSEENFWIVATSFSFFPTVVSGPIKRFDVFRHELLERKEFEYDLALGSVRRIFMGFFMKYVVADTLGRGVDVVFDNITQCSGGILLVASAMFTIQIYADFVGYSHIAIGLSGLFGFRLSENFQQPYFAISLKDFWRRWHISLSTWLRDYIYIPLGGNRQGKLKKYYNIMITFIVSGLWHGAGWNYILWGVIHGIGQVLDDIIGIDLRVKQSKSAIVKTLNWMLVMLFVNFAWVFFRVNSIDDIGYICSNIFVGIRDVNSYFGTIKSYFAMDRLGNMICVIDVVLLIVIEALEKFRGPYKYYKILSGKKGVFMEMCFALVIIFLMIKGSSVGFIYEGF